MSMRIQIGARLSVGSRVFELLVYGVRIDHDPDRAGEMLIPQSRRTAEIYNSICSSIERAPLAPRQAVMPIVNCVPIGPALTEPVFLHRLLQTPNIVVTSHDDAVCTRVEGIGAAILDVPASVSQPFESDQVMYGLPGNAGQRHLTGEMKNDDVPAFRHDLIRERFRVIRRQRLTQQMISKCAVEPTKLLG